jgi:hypothetical protein
MVLSFEKLGKREEGRGKREKGRQNGLPPS